MPRKVSTVITRATKVRINASGSTFRRRQQSDALPLTISHPDIVKLWDYRKNGLDRPEDYTFGSNKRVWWRCTKGRDHSWKIGINPRTKAQHKCPFCSGLRLSVTNSLQKLFPAIAKEWHAKLNEGITPADVTAHSSKYFWWQCKQNKTHVWKAMIANRACKGSGCPFCAGQQVSRENSLAARFPTIASQWHPTKNGKLKPGDVTGSSGKVAWWKCPIGIDHVWKTIIKSRTSDLTGCPVCAAKKTKARAASGKYISSTR